MASLAAGLSALLASSIMTAGIFGLSASDHFSEYVTMNVPSMSRGGYSSHTNIGYGGISNDGYGGGYKTGMVYGEEEGYKHHDHAYRDDGYYDNGYHADGYHDDDYGHAEHYDEHQKGYDHSPYDDHSPNDDHKRKNDAFYSRPSYDEKIKKDSEYEDNDYRKLHKDSEEAKRMYLEGLYSNSLSRDDNRRTSDYYGGYESRRRYREKRSINDTVSSINSDARKVTYEEVFRNMQMLNALRSSDSSKCAFRLVCELASQEGEQQPNQPGGQILQFVRHGDELLRSLPAGKGGAYFTMINEFKQTMYFGGKGGDCARRFPSCPLNSLTMVDMLYAV